MVDHDRSATVDIEALLRALPVSALEPCEIASIDGFIDLPEEGRWKETVWLYEPPAGQHMPYLDPAAVLPKLLRHQGATSLEVETRVREAVTRMKAEIPQEKWACFFDFFEPDTPACLPVSEFVAWLRQEGNHQFERAGRSVLVTSDIIDFLERASEVAAATPLFLGPDNRDEPWSLLTLPVVPPPRAMIEFVPGAPWADIDGWGDNWWNDERNPFMLWRESMRPIAQELERVLGEPVYDFADLESDTDDDNVHRFLVLHWCCTWQPDSAFVRYLLRVSGARNVATLKEALLDPANYTQAFKMHGAFDGIDASNRCRFNYVPLGQRKTVTVLFCTLQAREAAQQLLAQAIGAHALIIAPKELATEDWVRIATRYCRNWTAHYLFDWTLDQPIEILARTNELCVIADEQHRQRDQDLELSEGAEDLLWLALDLGIESRYFDTRGTQGMNPRASLERQGVPARVKARQAQWSCPNSPDTLTFLNKVIGFNDIGIQFFNTQSPFKVVG